MSKCSGGCDVLLERLGGEAGAGVKLRARSGLTALLGVRACRTGATIPMSKFMAELDPCESSGSEGSGAGKCAGGGVWGNRGG